MAYKLFLLLIASTTSTVIADSNTGLTSGLLARTLSSGVVVSFVLLVLVVLSILCWAVVFAKYSKLKMLASKNSKFIKAFWDSHSLNDLHSQIDKHDACSAKQLFNDGYGELIRGSQLKDKSKNLEVAVKSAMDNMSRTLRKSQMSQKKIMENHLSILAICASAAPFIGLFGTVWGIMNAFEGIARTGSASLAAVAPGISEALIATAFGLAAAIPAVIGYNIFQNMIRSQMIELDGFSSDFLNIVERYLVSEEES